MKNIIMYTGPMCAFCDAAKRLFKRNNANFKEINDVERIGAQTLSTAALRGQAPQH